MLPDPTSAGSLAWLPEAVAAIAVAGGVFKLGLLHADSKNLRSSLESEIKQIREVMAKILEFIEDSQKLRVSWGGFRTLTEETLPVHAREIEALKEADTQHTHRQRNLEQAVALVAARVDTVERRHMDRRREDRDGTI